MLPLSRRKLLTGSAASALSAWAGLSRARASVPDGKSPVVDTHLHCFAGDDPRFPYHSKAPYRPEAKATPQHLLECMDQAGVDFAVVVHPEPYQDDHRYLEYCLEVGGERLKGTCLFFADRPGSLDGMRPLVERHPGKIIAARVHAYARIVCHPLVRQSCASCGEQLPIWSWHYNCILSPGMHLALSR